MELRKTLFQVPLGGFRGVLKKSEWSETLTSATASVVSVSVEDPDQ